MTLPLTHTFSCIVAGPSRAGKTSFVVKLINNVKTMITPPPKNIIYCYSEWQPLYESLQGVKFINGLIDVNEINSSEPNLIILDDQMHSINEQTEMIFTKYSHHRNCSIIFITQNIFQRASSHMRTMSLNASYLMLFRNVRDVQQIATLARQMYPKGQSKFLVEAFEDATSENYGYLFIDLRQETSDVARIRTGIFPDEKTYIYVDKAKAPSLHIEI